MFGILLTLIFIRPFISSLAFPYLNYIYSALFLIFLIIWFISKNIPLSKIKPLKYPLILFCFAQIISVVFSTNKLNSFIELYKYISGLFLFLIVASLNDKDKIRIIGTVVLTGLFISLLAIYQYLIGFQHILEYMDKAKITAPFVLDYVGRKRVFFPFVTPNALAGYLAMIIPLVFINKYRVWFIIPLFLAVLLTKSLGALLSIFLALGLYFYLQGKLGKRRISFLVGLLVTIGAIFISRSITQKQHLQPIFSTLMRLNYWKETLRIIKAAPLTGIGIGNFNLAHSRYAHNSYLQIWAEMGILGIISFLWIIFITFNIGFKKLRSSENQNYIITGILAAIIVFLLHNFIDFSFFLPEVSIIWWAIFGLLLIA